MPDVDDFMPDDSLPSGSSGMRVNFTDAEAKSEALKPIPAGEYHVKLTDVSLETCGPTSKNPGKPYWGLVFTVQDGPHEGRRVRTNAMLFSPALYTLSQLLKASGFDIQAGEFELPDPETLITNDYLIKVKIKPETDDYDARNDIRSIGAYNGKVPTSREQSLLP
jgi:hypothetical protein